MACLHDAELALLTMFAVMTDVNKGTLAKLMPMTDRIPAPHWYGLLRGKRMPVTWMAVMKPQTSRAAWIRSAGAREKQCTRCPLLVSLLLRQASCDSVQKGDVMILMIHRCLSSCHLHSEATCSAW